MMIKDMVFTLIEQSLSGTNYDISLVVYELFKGDHVCGSIKNKQWYTFDGTKWVTTDTGPYTELSTTVFQEYKQYYDKLSEELESLTAIKDSKTNEISDTPDTPDTSKTSKTSDTSDIEKSIAALKDKLEKTENVMNKLKNVTSKETINRECLYTFYDPEFLNKLDKNEGLVGFINGVYHIADKKFKKGTKEDMISIFIDSLYEDCKDNMDSVLPRFIEYRQKLIQKRKSIRNVFII